MNAAKSAAGVVLTEPGLQGIVAAAKEGRSTFQRILTYTLNALNKKIEPVLFLGPGLIMAGHSVLTRLWCERDRSCYRLGIGRSAACS
jgi:H+-transporting ATPase